MYGVKLNQVKALVNLQDFKTSAFEKTPIYYMTSSSIEDVEAFDVFIESISLCQNGLFMIEKISENTHAGIFAKVYKERQQEAILNIANIQEQYFNGSQTIAYKIMAEERTILEFYLRQYGIENDYSTNRWATTRSRS